MILNSKFATGDQVVHIVNERKKVWVTCEYCEGNGFLKLANGKEIPCSKCYGNNGHWKYEDHNSWALGRILTIGQVMVIYTDSPGAYSEIQADNYAPQTFTKEEYMCVETGIGSGSVYRKEHLFEFQEEALRECEKRNQEEPNDNL